MLLILGKLGINKSSIYYREFGRTQNSPTTSKELIFNDKLVINKRQFQPIKRQCHQLQMRVCI